MMSNKRHGVDSTKSANPSLDGTVYRDPISLRLLWGCVAEGLPANLRTNVSSENSAQI